MSFDQSTRNRLQRFINSSREILREEFTRQLQAIYGLDPKQGTIADIANLGNLDNRQRQTAQLLRDTLTHYLATTPGKNEKERVKQVLDRIVREQSFTVLNRLAALRMAEARGFLLESIGNQYNSKGFKLYRQLSGTSHGETGDAYRNYLMSLFDEFSLDLAVLFDRHSPQGRLFPRESALIALLNEVNHHEVDHLWAEDETIGWIYQYFNSQEERRQMRAESQAPRNSRELAVRNQFFTPRYVVEFLTDNTLGRIWYEMTQGSTALVEDCRYLVRRPTEIFLQPNESAPQTEVTETATEPLTQEQLLSQPVYIPYRAVKDPRNIRMLDPACGSMHFGLYAFDLFERIYLEAWQYEQQYGAESLEREADQLPLQATFESFEVFKQQIPKLIIEHNIHGVDIDPRAVQIAGLSLWQRAQRAWHEQKIKPNQRPTIAKSNIVCAEPMPGEKALLQEFTSQLYPPVLGQLVEVIFDKMQLAGEAGTLLKIEEEIQNAIHKAREQWVSETAAGTSADMFQAELDAATAQIKLGFDLSGIDDERFWDDAEEQILQALSDYAQQAESGAEQKRLFAEDAAKGFGFIDLCRKRFDVVLMNPPFGDATENSIAYFGLAYQDLSPNIITQFVQRSKGIVEKNKGYIGIVLDRTVLIKNSYEKFRDEMLIKDKNIDKILDLGWNVLDANVEVSSIILSINKVESVFGINAVNFEEKETILQRWEENGIIVPNPSIYKFPNHALNLAMPSFFINSLIKYSSLEDEDIKFVNGHTIKSDVFKRLRWEIPQEMYDKGYAVSMWNGSAYSPFRVAFEESVIIENYGGGLANHGSTIYRSKEKHFQPGLCYGKRGDFLDVQVLPKGFQFTNEGFGARVYGDKLQIALSYLNSSTAQFFINLYCGQHKGVGYVNQLPFPIVDDDFLTKIKENIKQIIYHARCVQTLCITDHEFVLPIPQNTSFEFNGLDNLVIYIKYHYKEYLKALSKNDQLYYQVFKLHQNEIEVIENELVSKRTIPTLYYQNKFSDNNIKSDIAFSILFYFLQNYFMFDNHYIARFENINEELIVSYLNKGNVTISSNIIEEIITVSNNSILQIFNNSIVLFDFILNKLSKSTRQAPTYWQLQTPSGSYTLWLYYHRLNEQTLYTCVNDFVEPKLHQVEQDIHALTSKTVRSKQEEKELETLTSFASELRDFRDELLRIAKFWKPNLNDGIQITAAPLWKLFQHRTWQKKLKDTWTSLEQGDYDWSHLACSIWPDRVLRKCHQDRSFAIAHDVEDYFWQQVEVPIKRGNRLTGEVKIEWQPKDLDETALSTLIKHIKDEKQL